MDNSPASISDPLGDTGRNQWSPFNILLRSFINELMGNNQAGRISNASGVTGISGFSDVDRLIGSIPQPILFDWYKDPETGEVFWSPGEGPQDGLIWLGPTYTLKGKKGILWHTQNQFIYGEYTDTHATPSGWSSQPFDPNGLKASGSLSVIDISDFTGKGAFKGAAKMSVALFAAKKGVQGSVGKVGVGAAKMSTNIKYLGRMEDLKGIPRSQTILDDLPNLGSPKANYYQNMSVIRRNLREGVTFKDASWFRPNSELAPTLSWPTRTVGQTFYGAERNLMQNRGLWPK
jgi:hypothetical protein